MGMTHYWLKPNILIFMRIQIISSVESDGNNSKCDFNGEKLEADFFLLYILFYNTSYLYVIMIYINIILIKYIYQWLSSRMAF